MEKGARGKRHPPPVGATPKVDPRGRQALELVEALGEDFGEACEHALRQPEFSGLDLGPLGEVPMSRLEPGEIGWSRAIRLASASPGLADSPPASRAEIWCILRPVGRELGTELPGTERPGKTLGRSAVYAKASQGPPPRLLILRSDPGMPFPLLRRFAKSVDGELDAE